MRHCDLLFNIMVAINAHNFDNNDVHLLVNPMFHCTALYSTLPAAAYTRTPVVITDSTDGRELLELVSQHNVTTFLSVPTIFQRILEATPQPVTSSSLRLMAYAGSPMKVQTIHQLRHRFPDVALHNFFGLTETIAMTHVLRSDECESRPDSIGRLLPFIEAVIIDPESMQILPPGKIGELLFARNVVISTYFGQPELLNAAIVTIDGREWFRTGDLAMVDEEGFFFLKGRRKDMIIVGGENVYAAEVEAVLQNHPAIREAAVVGEQACGIRSALGEIVVAYVVTSAAARLSERELRAHCFEKLAGFKVPVKIYFLSQLPRNPAGKILRDQLTPSSES
jgi:acyl-CoA synthetase (AMP-forming)/AMP-acid ligase II